ncbi:MAG: PaaI family thioesterase [Chloroflexi bacterium]|nr:PaaI family thioesterase [Chloroflexota bacterium]MCL5108390.1 PaaI family thioesterase [Chloroflexota bacterium]
MSEKSATRRQPGYRKCFVCGNENPIGLKVAFYHDGQKVWTEFTPGDQHQGYPGVMHGGIIYTLLDETIGRVAFLKDMWVVTARMQVRYRQPVHVGQKLRIEAEIVRVRGRVLEAAGRALLPDGKVAAEANGLFMELPASYRQELAEIVFEEPSEGDSP